MTRPAALWKALEHDKVQCRLCAHFCILAPGQRGRCGVRENQQGVLFTLVYDKIAALNLDPVEKKPLFHFLPGTTTLSLGTPGCNLACSFCQNASLSQPPRPGQPIRGQRVTPQELVRMAQQAKASSLAYTYSEPTIFFELMRDTAEQAQQAGLANIMVSNGFQSPDCLDALGGLIQAANIDLKAFRNSFYRDVCAARLTPVLKNLVRIRALGWHLEVTTLVIPDLNDSDQELNDIANFIARELGPDTPWHVSRFHGCHQLADHPSTPLATLQRAYEIGRAAGLHYVFVGNVPGSGLENTVCPKCGQVVIKRQGFALGQIRLEHGRCTACHTAILKPEHLGPTGKPAPHEST